MKKSTEDPTRVRVVSHDPRWAAEFAKASEEIAVALGTDLRAIHHIGSTSVPGIHAKPVIDILVVVTDLAAADRRTPEMRRLGYEAMGEFGIGGRRYFRRDDPAGRRTHQVHSFADGSPHVNRHLAFRDFLRAHPASARQYDVLKQSLARAHPHDMGAYMAGKDGFVKDVERRALAWFVASVSDVVGLSEGERNGSEPRRDSFARRRHSAIRHDTRV